MTILAVTEQKMSVFFVENISTNEQRRVRAEDFSSALYEVAAKPFDLEYWQFIAQVEMPKNKKYVQYGNWRVKKQGQPLKGGL